MLQLWKLYGPRPFTIMLHALTTRFSENKHIVWGTFMNRLQITPKHGTQYDPNKPLNTGVFCASASSSSVQKVLMQRLLSAGRVGWKLLKCGRCSP